MADFRAKYTGNGNIRFSEGWDRGGRGLAPCIDVVEIDKKITLKPVLYL